jgi:DNA-binding winged helix-turn-helix (wHTH) protein
LLISALILRWKYRVASTQELDDEIYALRERLADVESRRLLRAEASHRA